MRPTIHPAFHEDAIVTCACGATFVTGSTASHLRVEACSACHPFFTDSIQHRTSSRIDRFNARAARAA